MAKVKRRKTTAMSEQKVTIVGYTGNGYPYQTRDSGVRQEYSSGMKRDTQDGKPRFDLLLSASLPYGDQFLTRLAELLTRGAEKYGDRNWELADSLEELDRFVASAFRHFIQWATAERDEDHGIAIVFNIMAAEYVRTNMERGTVGRI